MAAWLEDWGEPGEADGMDGILPGESVMMTDDDMSALEASNGPEFDVMFLEMMILHHSSAVDMAEAELVNGRFPEAIKLASAIEMAQEAEIGEMRSEEHTSELQSLMRISSAVFCLKKNTQITNTSQRYRNS